MLPAMSTGVLHIVCLWEGGSSVSSYRRRQTALVPNQPVLKSQVIKVQQLTCAEHSSSHT
jgi:hypothetical protein